ncbi:hypothetical protein SAY87_017248 [Trapa incisa]|uniref:Uncharacterized protein n=1 Tax=Trapa incisa TaxID=236973 RepID=A0AAN7QW04_9MYRT|nr:hypothetical protein SAY87_017248 [Trapa incisa]
MIWSHLDMLCFLSCTKCSCRDDLESLGYVLMYFLRGRTYVGVILQNLLHISTVKSLRFDDKPDYADLKRLFRDLFICEGCKFDWDILKNKKSQVATPPGRALGSGAGPSFAVHPFADADRPLGEEGRPSGSGLKQKSPAGNDSSMPKMS